MEQFAAVALAHFLALLIPGVDFFLIARTAIVSGRRSATGTCVGIAVANGVFIAAAFTGVALITYPAVMRAVQGAGGVYLVIVGATFWRTRGGVASGSAEREGETEPGRDDRRQTSRHPADAGRGVEGSTGETASVSACAPAAPWWRNAGLGLASGLLNPKNAVFYVSLAAAVSTASTTTMVAYGAWMFTVVLACDILVAAAFGSRAALARMDRALPWMTRIAGGFLVLFGLGMLVRVIADLAR